MIKEQNKLRRGGRPSVEQAEKLGDKILDAAASLFFSAGYGLTSIEAVCKGAHISKRTFYARYENKEAVFSAVVHRVIGRIRPPDKAIDQLFEGDDVSEILRRIAPIILNGSLSKDSLAMYRVVMSEARRFPELARVMNEQSVRQEAIHRIALLLQRTEGSNLSEQASSFAAEQFLAILTSAPQRRALGLGVPLSAAEIDLWIEQTISLFLNGYTKIS